MRDGMPMYKFGGIRLDSLVLLILGLVGLVGIISNSLLVHGVNQGKGDLFMFWLVWEGLIIVLHTLLYSYLLVEFILFNISNGYRHTTAAANMFNRDYKASVIGLMIYLVFVALYSFFWEMVNSYRKVLGRAREVAEGEGYEDGRYIRL